MAAASARIPPSCPCPVGAPTNGAPSHASLPTTRPSPRNLRAPVTGAPIGAPPTNSSGRLPTATAPTPPSHSSPATFLDGLTCLRRGCTSQVPQFCSTGCCDTHCRSRRCLHHSSDRRFAQPVETRTSSSQLPPSTTPPRLRVCRAVGCHSSTHSRCRVGFCSNHCRSSRCRATRQPASTQPTCRRPVLQRTRATRLPCWLLQSPLYQPTLSTSRSLILVGKRPGGGSLLNDGSATPTSLVQPLGFAQFNCRRLWGSHDAVHDGFMGLVSCLDQLHVRVVCVQETQAPSLGTLPVDQSFRYDGPLGSYGRVPLFYRRFLHPRC